MVLAASETPADGRDSEGRLLECEMVRHDSVSHERWQFGLRRYLTLSVLDTDRSGFDYG